MFYGIRIRRLHRRAILWLWLPCWSKKSWITLVQCGRALSSLHIATLSIFMPRNTKVAGYYGFTCVCPSARPSVSRTSVRISFSDDNLSKSQCIFTELVMCTDIVEIWFGIANWQISSNFDGVICPRRPYFRFRTITCKCQGILTKFSTCIDLGGLVWDC